MNLHHRVHLLEPLIGLLHGFFARSIDARLKIGAGFYVDGEFAREFKVNGIQPASDTPLRGQILRWGGRVHGFTIQLGTSLRKRAATRVLPG